MAYSIKFVGLKELQAAIQRNPQQVVKEARTFLTRGIELYNAGIIRNPWRIGQSGGGVPVRTGNLRDTHRRTINNFEASIFPTAKYAPYIHGIEGFPRKRSYQLRPWLDYVKEKSEPHMQVLYERMLDNIVKDLAK